MRVFALSDIHIDYEVNAKWIADLSLADYREDLLILAGDVTDNLKQLGWCLSLLSSRFAQVLFVPGNHELWVVREDRAKNSLEKFQDVVSVAASSGVSMRPYSKGGVAIVPLLGWYDYSFGEPTEELLSIWMDFHACRWPNGIREREISTYFASLNNAAPMHADTLITFSHFLPRIDVMPYYAKHLLYPILGSSHLERQLREIRPSMHVYGHSHINRRVAIDGVTYINNAFGYPRETRIAKKRLLCIHEC